MKPAGRSLARAAAFAACVCAPPRAPAADEAAPALTIAQAVERAVANSPEVQALRAAEAAAQAWARAACDRRDPELRVGYGRESGEQRRLQTLADPADGAARNEFRDSDGGQYRAGLRVFPANPWERAARVEELTAEWRAAQAELAHRQWTLGAQVRRLAAELNFLCLDADCLEQILAARRAQLEAGRAGHAGGTVPLADSMAIARRYLTAMANRDRAARRRDTALRELAALLNLPPSRARVEPAALPATPDLSAGRAAALEQAALQSRADLRAMRFRTAAARGAYRRLRATGLPWFNHIEAAYRWQDADTTSREYEQGSGVPRGVQDEHGSADEWRVDAAVSLPVFSRFNREDDAQRVEWEQAALTENEHLRRVARQVGDAIEALRTVREAWARQTAEVEPVLREMEDAANDAGAAAQLTAADKAGLRADIAEARRSRLASAYEYQAALIDLEEAVGVPLASVP